MIYKVCTHASTVEIPKSPGDNDDSIGGGGTTWREELELRVRVRSESDETSRRDLPGLFYFTCLGTRRAVIPWTTKCAPPCSSSDDALRPHPGYMLATGARLHHMPHAIQHEEVVMRRQ